MHILPGKQKFNSQELILFLHEYFLRGREFGISWREVTHETVMDFICWLDLQGWRVQVSNAVAAI